MTIIMKKNGAQCSQDKSYVPHPPPSSVLTTSKLTPSCGIFHGSLHRKQSRLPCELHPILSFRFLTTAKEINIQELVEKWETQPYNSVELYQAEHRAKEPTDTVQVHPAFLSPPVPIVHSEGPRCSVVRGSTQVSSFLEVPGRKPDSEQLQE